MTIMPDKLIAARNARGWSQGDLAQRSGVSQQTIGKLEKGAARTSKFLIKIARSLEIAPSDLDDDFGADQALAPAAPASGYRPPPEFLGARDFKVFASAECGPGEIQVFSTEPYELIPRPWVAERDLQAFGVLLTGDSMEPLYEAGQIAVVSPKAPLVKGKQALFLAEPMGGDFRASVKRYRGQTADKWLVKQLNPEREFVFERKEWGTAYRVLGALDG